MVFGIIKWYIKPVNIAVEDQYAANLLTNEVIGFGKDVRAPSGFTRIDWC